MPPSKSYPAKRLACLFLLAISCAIFPAAYGQISTNNGVYARRAEKAFLDAGVNYAAAPDIATNCWQLGRTAFDWCAFATNDTQRGDIAKAGISGGQRLTAKDPNSAVGHYYLAMCYGELAQAEAPSLAAYQIGRAHV